MWCAHGKLHRVDGPAVTGTHDEWWCDGNRVGDTDADQAALAAEHAYSLRSGDFTVLAVLLPLWHPGGPGFDELRLVLKLPT